MIPKRYQWIETLPELPKMVQQAIQLYGITEIPGARSNKIIMDWSKEVNLQDTYVNDDTPWCGLFMAVVVKRSGREPVKSPLWARSWAKWGVGVPSPELGDIVVFSRNGGGHVGLYVGEDSHAYHILGGNQKNMVNITRLAKARAIAFRRPAYKNQPASVKKYFLSSEGEISNNEA